jgi:CheY-like chemotaxis protein/HPt (histidine-containing phosphotransfer) domain-containing protein
MNIATQVLKAAMPELRTRYATRLRMQSNELLDFISRCERGKLTDDACGEVRMLAHSLCGSGTTFGFPEISDAARYLEDAIDCGPPHNLQTYVELALRVIRACDPVVDDGDDAQVSGAQSETPATQEIEQPLLLVVSDDQSTVSILNQMFGARVEIVATANQLEALELLKFRNPAAVIFDMRPPHFIAALEILYTQARRQNVAVIAIVPSRQSAAIAHAISAGDIQCIVKPLSVEKLYHSAHTTIERKRLSVLVGDDDVIVREMITNRFKSYGFSVVGANDGAQVLDLAARYRPSIIVLDRIMPGIEGVAVLRMLKANPITHEIPVIMLSAKRKANEIADARRAGAADYIVKPFKPDQVVIRCMRELGLPPRPVSRDFSPTPAVRLARRALPRA